MSTLTPSYITLFIKEWEKQMEKTKNELRNRTNSKQFPVFQALTR